MHASGKLKAFHENTGWDLVANLVGCLTAALVIHITTKRTAPIKRMDG